MVVLNLIGLVVQLHGAMMMEDYESNLTSLKAFCLLAEDELVINHGDPAASSLPQTGMHCPCSIVWLRNRKEQ